MNAVDLQRAFVAHIRDPERHPAPAGLEDRRMRIYRELVGGSITSLLAGAFPVLSVILGKERWATLALGFIRDHRCRTPLFTEIPREFLGWLDTVDDGTLADVPFFRELAHYEWVESALDLSPATLPDDGIDPRGDLLTGVPVPSPLAWPLRYRYPVHRLSPDYRPSAPPEAPSCFVAWRNRSDVVRFMSVNAPTLRLVELMHVADSLTGRELLARIAAELPDTPANAVLEGGGDALETLRELEVVLGVRAAGGSPSAPLHPRG